MLKSRLSIFFNVKLVFGGHQRLRHQLILPPHAAHHPHLAAGARGAHHALGA